jgi:phage terminase Nu1 subunit (DNA packaging protein)
MNIIAALDTPVSQSEFARLVGRSEGRVSQLVGDGTLQPGATAGEWLKAYVDRLSREAAGRASDGPLDLVQERAALARSQRESVDLRNAVLRGEYAPISLLSQVLATASQAVAERFEHLPAHLRKTCPNLTDDEREQVAVVIAQARNEWVRATAELVAQQMDDAGDGEVEDVEGPPSD